MKHIRTIGYILSLAALAAAAGCEDNRNQYLEDYQTLIYFRNGGEQNITLYKVGEDAFYEIPICKAGRDIEGTATISVVSMPQMQLDIYNLDNRTGYTQLPDNCWSFVDTEDESKVIEEPVEFTFTEQDSYKVTKVRLRTNDISALEEANPDKEYVLALQVFADPKVSEDINILILRPGIDIPKLALSQTGLYSYYYTSENPAENEYKNSIVLGMDNRWDFNCTLKIMDETWVSEYNKTNGTSYTLLPQDAYSINPEVAFTQGSKSSEFAVNVDRSELELLKEYILPVYLTDCSKEEFEIDEDASSWILNFRLDPDQIPLTVDMLSSPYTASNDGAGLEALVSDPANNWWHSIYSGGNTGDPTYGHYIDIALKESLTDIVLKYQTRTSNNNGVPTKIVIGVGTDGSTYTTLSTVESGLPTEAAAWGTLPAMHSDTPFTHIRFGIATSALGDLTQTDAGTALSELQLFGANNQK